MFYQAISFFFSLLFLAIASYTDLKKRTVSNKITYSMIALGMVISLAFSVIQNNYSIIYYSIFATAATFILGYILWKIGVWAGGDVKLFTGVAALNPFNPNILLTLGIVAIPLFKSSAHPIFPLTLFIFSIFSMMPVAMIMAAKELIKQKTLPQKVVNALKENIPKSIEWGIMLGGISYLVGLLNLNPITEAIAGIIAIMVFATLEKKLGILAVIIAFMPSLINNPSLAIAIAVFASLSMLLLFFLLKGYSITKKALSEKRKISSLEEGEIVAETIAEEDGKIRRIHPLSVGIFLGLAIKGKQKQLMELIRPKGRIIASHRQAAGLDEEQLEELKELAKARKIENEIMVKKSVPFVPAVLFAYIILNIVGDLLWNIIIPAL